MSDKSLKSKAINIKGKNYVLVSDRVVYFNEQYPSGSITTDYTLDGNTYQFKATVTPDCDKPARTFTGHSQATIGDGMVNKTAAMENAETSAVGRALAMMGIGVIESIASVDEINKATGSVGVSNNSPRYITENQVKFLMNKVTWGLKYHDKEEVLEFLDGVFGAPINELLQEQMDEALEKLNKAIVVRKAEDKKKDQEAAIDIKVKGQLDIPMTDGGDIDLTDIPF